MCTLLATLAVDMVGFYMDYAESNMIFGKVKILQTNVTVVSQGIRTAFDQGTATSEHCSVGCTAIGLNNKLYCTHGSITSSSDKSMIPTDVIYRQGPLSGADDKVPMIMGVPRHAHMYFALRQTNDRAPESADRTKYPINECGWYKLDNYIL